MPKNSKTRINSITTPYCDMRCCYCNREFNGNNEKLNEKLMKLHLKKSHNIDVKSLDDLTHTWINVDYVDGVEQIPNQYS